MAFVYYCIYVWQPALVCEGRQNATFYYSVYLSLRSALHFWMENHGKDESQHGRHSLQDIGRCHAITESQGLTVSLPPEEQERKVDECEDARTCKSLLYSLKYIVAVTDETAPSSSNDFLFSTYNYTPCDRTNTDECPSNVAQPGYGPPARWANSLEE